MPHNTLTTGQTYKFIPTHTNQGTISRSDVLRTAYSITAFALTTVLICLGLRILMALLVITGPISQGLTTVTDPIVAPFTSVFNDPHGMVQACTALAFTTYYAVYWLVAIIHRFTRQNNQYYSRKIAQ